MVVGTEGIWTFDGAESLRGDEDQGRFSLNHTEQLFARADLELISMCALGGQGAERIGSGWAGKVATSGPFQFRIGSGPPFTPG